MEACKEAKDNNMSPTSLWPVYLWPELALPWWPSLEGPRILATLGPRPKERAAVERTLRFRLLVVKWGLRQWMGRFKRNGFSGGLAVDRLSVTPQQLHKLHFYS